MGGKPKAAGDNFAPVFNKGLTLFKAALIAFCIVIAESLAVFFVKAKIGVSGLYPAIGCGAGFLAFLVCTIMYACGYRPQSRLYPQRLYPICHRRHRGNDDRRISQGRSQAARGAAQVCASARHLPSQPRFLCGILLFIFSKFEKLCRRKRINVLSIIKSPCASRLQELFYLSVLIFFDGARTGLFHRFVRRAVFIRETYQPSLFGTRHPHRSQRIHMRANDIIYFIADAKGLPRIFRGQRGMANPVKPSFPLADMPVV